jgi:hypothetical protein
MAVTVWAWAIPVASSAEASSALTNFMIFKSRGYR